MASFVTNRGKLRLLEWSLRDGAPAGAGLAVFLATNATPPTVDTNLKSELTEIATGNGYVAGGQNIARNSTDFDTLTEDDALDRAFTRLRDIVWTASGGPIPASGSGARWMVLTDQNAALGSREVIACFDLQSDRSISDTQSLTIQDAEIRATE